VSLEDILANENAAVAAQAGSASLKPALAKLAESLEQLDPGFAPDVIKHLQDLKVIPPFYGEIPPFPKKPENPYATASASGDLPTHDAVIEYEDDMMFYRKDCAEFAKALAKAVREFSEGA
jgi:hypothetical protein